MSGELSLRSFSGYNELKRAVREGVLGKDDGNASRQYFWSVLIHLRKEVEELPAAYPDVEGPADRLLKMSLKHFPGFTSLYSTNRDALVALVERHKDVEIPALLIPFLEILSTVIPKLDVCYLIACDMLTNKTKYIIPTAIGHRNRLYTFRQLLSAYMPKTYAILSTIGALEDAYLNLMFVDFFRTLLPFQHVLRMCDCYLLEGSRILYRYGLALIKGYKHRIKAREFSHGSALWREIQSRSKVAELVVVGETEAESNQGTSPSQKGSEKMEYLISEIHNHSFEKGRSPLGKMLRPMGISRHALQKLSNELQTSRSASSHDSLVDFSVYGARDTDEDDLQVGLKYVEAGEHKIDDDVKRAQQTETVGLRIDLKDGAFDSVLLQSRILEPETASILFDYLPKSATLDGLQLAFSTFEHGWDISNLYAHTDSVGPCVLLLRTLKSKAVFGAFISTDISPPSLKIRGTGESFVFRLNGPKRAKYEWSMLNAGGTSQSPSHSYSSASNPTLNQFAVFARDHIQIGGSATSSTNAIYLDETLHCCSSGPSDTFDNPPLVEQEEFEDKTKSTFEVDAIEVFATKSGYTRASMNGKLKNLSKKSVLGDTV